MTLNIWLICQYAGSPTMGMNYRPYYFAREFIALGHRVTVVSGSYSHQFQRLPELSSTYTKAEVDGVPYLWIRTPRYASSSDPKRALSWAVFAARLATLPRRGLDKPDVIIVSSPAPYPIFPAARLAKRYGAALVFEERDLWPLSLIELGGYAPSHPVIRLTQAAEDFALRHADLVVVPLPNAFEHFRTRGLKAERFLHISNGVEESAALLSVAGASADQPADRPFTALYAGSFHARNSAMVFIQAARLLAERGSAVRICFIGKDGGGLAAMKAAAQGLGNVEFLEAVPRTAMARVLATVDVCLAATRASGLYRFGISLTKLFDYMAAAKPVVLSTNASGDLVSAHGFGLTVPPEDPVAVARALDCLASMPRAELTAMGDKGRKELLASYTYGHLALKYAKALERAVAERRRC